MISLPPSISGYEDKAERYLQSLKDFTVAKLGDVPVLGDYLKDGPLWFYGALAVAAFFFSLYVISKVLSHLREKTGEKLRGSRLGAMAEKNRIMGEAAKAARKKDPSRAAELYLSVGEVASAAEVLEKAGLYAKAGQMYDGMGQTDHALALYEKAGEHAWLADALNKQGKHARAADIYLKMGKKLLAAEGYEKAGANQKAAELFEEAGHTATAAGLYEKARDYKKSAMLFERAYVEGTSSQEALTGERARKLQEMSVKAGTYFEKTGEFKKAAEAFSRVHAYQQAGEAALSAGDRQAAAEYFRMGKDYERASGILTEDGNTIRAAEVMAEKYMNEGNDSQAARMYMEAGEHIKAAELFDHVGEYVMAGEAYIKDGELISAAEVFIKGGEKERAAVAYAGADRYRQAADIYIELGDMEKASALIEKSGDYMEAADIYRKAGQAEKEVAALQKVGPDDPRFNTAVIRLAGLFRDRGKLQLAAEKYLQAISEAEPDQSNVDLFYGLGHAYEEDKRYDEAAAAYRKVQLVDLNYRDVEERLRECAKFEGQSKVDTKAQGISAPSESEAAKRYTINQEIGRGGMGVVYKARDNNLNRVIALKLLPKNISDNPKVIKRFAAEARSAAQLNHPNIVTLYDFQHAGGRSFITMEYVEGATLKKVLTKMAKVPIPNALKIIYQCCQGLEYAHKQGIIHRDIKPSNIMINKQNVIKIMDFGLAKVMGEETITEPGAISGTVLYMSPEQLLGHELDRTTDLYALGLVFYELVAGKHPFGEGDAAYHNIHTIPRPPKELRPDLPDNLNAIILKCLEKDRSKRFQSALQFGLAIREAVQK